MKFVLGNPIDKPKLEPRVYFWLENDDDEISLKVHREDQEDTFTILRVNSNGLQRLVYVPDDLGFLIDSRGRILEE